MNLLFALTLQEKIFSEEKLVVLPLCILIICYKMKNILKVHSSVFGPNMVFRVSRVVY